MKLQYKIWLVTSAIIVAIMAADLMFSVTTIEASIRDELTRDAKDIRALLMATRRVYHRQFLDSGLPVDDQTIGFLPAHALSRISQDFHNWTRSGLSFNNVSDQPRNPANRADAYELEAMAWFRAHPKAEERLVEIKGEGGKDFYHYTTPIWIEAYCLKCHGDRGQAPASVARSYDNAYGYKVGDLRGVMSVKLPTGPLRDREYREWFGRFAVRVGGYLLLLVVPGDLVQPPGGGPPGPSRNHRRPAGGGGLRRPEPGRRPGRDRRPGPGLQCHGPGHPVPERGPVCQ